jgi:hypothetical protein
MLEQARKVFGCNMLESAVTCPVSTSSNMLEQAGKMSNCNMPNPVATSSNRLQNARAGGNMLEQAPTTCCILLQLDSFIVASV